MRAIAALFCLVLVFAGGRAHALQSDYKNADLASDAVRLAAQAAHRAFFHREGQIRVFPGKGIIGSSFVQKPDLNLF